MWGCPPFQSLEAGRLPRLGGRGAAGAGARAATAAEARETAFLWEPPPYPGGFPASAAGGLLGRGSVGKRPPARESGAISRPGGALRTEPRGARGSRDRDARTLLTATTGFGGRGVLRRGIWGSHPGAELLPLVGVASRPPPVAGPVVATKSGGPGAGRQQRAEAPGQASAGGRGEYEQRGQREEAERDERRGAAV